jgi:Arc/MetJ family transcription regulator
MTKRMVDIDDVKLSDARAALGTTTIKETVELALEQAVINKRERQQRAIEALAAMNRSREDPDAERATMWRQEG